MSKLHRLMTRHAQTAREPRPKPQHREIEDKTVPFVAPPIRHQWDVVMLSPQANDGTLGRIQDAGFDVWRPRMVIKVSSARIGAAAWVNRPLWPRYAFLGRNDGCASASDVPYVGPVRGIGVMSGRMVAAIADREERGEFDCRTLPPAPPTFNVGDHVQTLDGLLDGIVLRSEGERVFLLRQFLGSTREIEAHVENLKECT